MFLWIVELSHGLSACEADLVPTASSRAIAPKTRGFDSAKGLMAADRHRFSLRLQCECTATRAELGRIGRFHPPASSNLLTKLGSLASLGLSSGRVIKLRSCARSDTYLTPLPSCHPSLVSAFSDYGFGR